MVYGYLADFIVLLHAFFVVFIVLGGVLVFWKPSIAWYHIPAVFWAASIEFLGWICPLTPLENLLRVKGGEAGYATGFVEHYIVPVLYPAQLTRKMQIGLGIIVLAANTAVYIIFWLRSRRVLKGGR
ncbi:MAG: DUF2784 domain-containing protein [Desulfobulbales bacterium]|nr:DUF2784 domain-containing protein [Desulfobulbales bacterium]